MLMWLLSSSQQQMALWNPTKIHMKFLLFLVFPDQYHPAPVQNAPIFGNTRPAHWKMSWPFSSASRRQYGTNPSSACWSRMPTATRNVLDNGDLTGHQNPLIPAGPTDCTFVTSERGICPVGAIDISVLLQCGQNCARRHRLLTANGVRLAGRARWSGGSPVVIFGYTTMA